MIPLLVTTTEKSFHMRPDILSVFLFAACLATAAATSQAQVVASFGGECEGIRAEPSPKLASLIRRVKQAERNPCDWAFCDGVFAHDLNGDGRREYFVRLACGATGNCKWGIFSDKPAKLRGTFTGWFFYIHRRTGPWNALTAYTREGANQGVIVRLRNRDGAYVQRSETTEQGYYGNDQPFLRLMGIPKCS
jgi:hypothetical protein